MNANNNVECAFDGILIVCCLVFLIWIMWFDGIHYLDVAGNVVIGWLVACWKWYAIGILEVLK